MFNSILFIIFGYLLGSIPFGYLVTLFSARKNILEIGWRKTSGSNVFKNVGKWQGLATGLLDVGKGVLAVWLAQKFGLPVPIQALCGVAAVTGHNWSCFLKFAGGRGIGTFIGAFLVLSPTILGFSVIFLVALALVWNAAIGTIVFLVAATLIAAYLGQLATVGILPLVSFLPVFLKRLSPINELDKKVIKNRLIFDDDIPRFDFRFKRMLQKLTKR